VRLPILGDFPESFETERLLIRCPLPGDGPEVHAAVHESMSELLPWMDWPREHKKVEDSEERIRRDRVRFLERSDLLLLLFLKGTNTLVGGSELHRMDWSVPRFEIGYWCRTRYAGRGYVTEAVRGIAGFAFEHLGARRVQTRCDSLNERIVRVAERAGYRQEGKLGNAEVGTDGAPSNVLAFSMLPADRAAGRRPQT
jgi:RimJ/RimL family protein N-acetyltransferase